MPIDQHNPATTRPDTRGFTQVPNLLLFDLLPKLKDSELRLLLVVFAATIGQVGGSGGTRKSCAWLTQSLLKKRTGRSHQAVSAAIDGLVRQNYLHVQREDGALVLTARERRGAHAKLYYALSPHLLGRMKAASPTQAIPFHDSRIRKADTTKQKREVNRDRYKEALSVSDPKAPRVSGWASVASVLKDSSRKEAA